MQSYQIPNNWFVNKDPEIIKQAVDNIINIYNKDLLPISHIKFLEKLRYENNIKLDVCYDIGSSVLHWSRHAKRLWPETKIYLFDAFSPLEIIYKNYDYEYYLGILSNTDDNELKFYQNDFLIGGNSYYRELGFDNSKYYPEDAYLLKKTKTLDTIVKERNYLYPDLIKIDVQGAELDIIKGGLDVLANTKYLIVELQDIEYNIGAPKVDITKPYLESLGWKCIEEKFSDNGPDGDYFFINTKLV